MKLAIILAEFGKPKPDVSQFHHWFPGADVQVYGDGDVPRIPQFEGPRYGWRAHDYWNVRMALDSDADVAIAWDADMRIVSEDVRTLPLLAGRFGLCLPANPRLLVRVDTMIGADSDGQLDATNGTGYAMNCTPIAINLHHVEAVACAEAFCGEMMRRPVRGPLAWWRACYRTGFSPCLLPPQWCVCAETIGCGNEIALHIGHDAVQTHYATHRPS
jgi:hypothetical protein